MKIKLTKKEKIKLADLFLTSIDLARKDELSDGYGYNYVRLQIGVHKTDKRPMAEIVREDFKIS